MEITNLKENRICPVCEGILKRHFTAKILCKYTVSYFLCTQCGLMKTENPYWLDEAYNSAIADLDVGLVQRNIWLSDVISKVLDTYFDTGGRFLDFAGGYGLFVRLMRDKGFDFYRYDKYCQNIFTEYFDVPFLTDELGKFELVTAFEVLEHIADPVNELKKIFAFTDSILITTELLLSDVSSVDDWWYFVPETGQHITFYTEKSLRKLAAKLKVNCYSNGRSFHILTKKVMKKFSFFPQPNLNLIEKVCTLLSQKFALPKNKNLRNQSVSIKNDFEHIKRNIWNK